MKITEEVREYARQQGVDAEEALEAGMEEKAKEFAAAAERSIRSAEYQIGDVQTGASPIRPAGSLPRKPGKKPPIFV